MSIYFNKFYMIKPRVNYILDSFQSQFWTNEHPWFVRCHWNSENQFCQCILFYTLPYTFSHLPATNNHLWYKSTCPYNGNHWSSSRVHHLSYNSHSNPSKEIEQCPKLNTDQTISSSKMNKIFRFGSKRTRSFSLSNNNSTIVTSSVETNVKMTSFAPLVTISPLLHFPNIYELSIELPFDESFWWIVPKLNRLTSLNIKVSTQNINQSHLQSLLDRTSCLYSLGVNINLTSSSKLSLFNNKCTSIRRLDFKKTVPFDQCPFFNHEQCIALTRSSLGKQCEVLSIAVRYRRSILFLIKTMSNLRALNIRCQDDQYASKIWSLGRDDLIQWIKSHLPSTINIERDIRYTHDIRLWIR